MDKKLVFEVVKYLETKNVQLMSFSDLEGGSYNPRLVDLDYILDDDLMGLYAHWKGVSREYIEKYYSLRTATCSFVNKKKIKCKNEVHCPEFKKFNPSSTYYCYQHESYLKNSELE